MAIFNKIAHHSKHMVFIVVGIAIGVGMTTGYRLWVSRVRNYEYGSTITSDGVYETSSGKRLVIKRYLTLLDIQIRSSSGRVLCRCDVNPSAYSSWVMCIDQSDRVWLASSDIGTYVWVPIDGSDQLYQQVGVAGSKLESEKPPALEYY